MKIIFVSRKLHLSVEVSQKSGLINADSEIKRQENKEDEKKKKIRTLPNRGQGLTLLF